MRRSRTFVLVTLALLAGVGCVDVEDDPSNVHDLRVLGVAFNPPEQSTPDCASILNANNELQLPPEFQLPVEMSALVVDPHETGRDIEYDVAACAAPDDSTCTETPEERVELDHGTLHDGTWSRTLAPGAAHLSDGTALLLRVFNRDPYRGLGGLRMPVVLHLRAGTEEIYAQKLMVYSCKAYPESKPNVTPVLPGVRLDDVAWPENLPFEVHGTSDVTLTPEPFEERQEHFVVPGLNLAAVQLDESWRISWYTTLGALAPLTTGGVDLGGEVGRHVVTWTVGHRTEPEDARFFIVVRDGRGGESWLVRRVHIQP